MRHTKKVISLALSAMITFSLTGTVYAGRVTDSYTPDDVMEWLEEGDDNSENAVQQTVNGLARTAEMLGYVTDINANEDQSDRLVDILNTVGDSMGSQDTTSDQDMAVAATAVFHIIEVISEETDPDGQYQDQVDALDESFNDGDNNAESTEEQVVNALYHSVKLLALITEECCSSQDMVDQIEGALEQFNEDDEAAEDLDDQMAVGAKWLFKMLGAFSRVQNSNNVDALTELTDSVEQQVEADTGSPQAVVHWLYGTVQVAESLA